MTSMAALLAAESDDGSSAGPGFPGFLVVIFLLVALVVLYLSLRKQIRKVDFDPEGTTDEERMHGRSRRSDER